MNTSSNRGRQPRSASADELAKLCGEPGPGDGVDPRDELRPVRRRGQDRKTLQLCAAVARVLVQSIDGHVVSVDPAPNAGRLLVTVETDDDPAAVRTSLDAARGRLRSEVAAAIHRKKAPELTFAVRPVPGREVSR